MNDLPAYILIVLVSIIALPILMYALSMLALVALMINFWVGCLFLVAVPFLSVKLITSE